MQKTKEPEIVVIPTEEVFANNLAQSFLRENGLDINLDQGETTVGVLLTIPELTAKFSMWLCNLIRETSYEEISSPQGTKLN